MWMGLHNSIYYDDFIRIIETQVFMVFLLYHMMQQEGFAGCLEDAGTMLFRCPDSRARSQMTLYNLKLEFLSWIFCHSNESKLF